MQPFTLAPASETAAVGVLAQSASSCAAELLTIRAWATRYGLEVLDLGTSAEPNGVDTGCQLVIALGGDGTILRALQVAMAQHAAVLGVNFGHVGFLADIRGDELPDALERVGSGQALLDERTALVAQIATEPARRFIAFNDVVIARLPGFGLARLRVVVAGESADARPRVLGMTMIMGLAFPAAIRLSRMRCAHPPPGARRVQCESSSPPPWFR